MLVNVRKNLEKLVKTTTNKEWIPTARKELSAAIPRIIIYINYKSSRTNCYV